MPAKYAAEPGPWRSARFPYQPGMLDAAADPAVDTVVFMTGSQVGKTSILDAIEGFFIDQDPSPLLVVFPTVVLAEGYSRDRLAPLIQESPALLARVGGVRSRDTGNTLLHKEFPGGHLTLAGANSAASLQSRPIRVVVCDEVDSFPPDADGQGDPVDLAIQRTTRFSNRLVVLSGTPGRKGLSRLERAWLDSDQRRFFVPCPACGAAQVLVWAQVRWQKNAEGEHQPETTRYVCEHCGVPWRDTERLEAVRHGEWRATAPFHGTAGFHIWEAYATHNLAGLVKEWLAKHKNRKSRQTFVNLKLGELWAEDDGQEVEWVSLKQRVEPYPTLEAEGFEVPPGVLFVTAGVDTQNDRLACAMYGWGRGEEAWLLHWVQLFGDPAEQWVWDQLDLLLNARLPHPYGEPLNVWSVGVDTGGGRTQAVYAYCRARAPRVMACKGSSVPGRPVLAGRPTPQDVAWSGQRIPNGVQLWPVGSDTAKEEIYSRLGIEAPGPKYIHLPDGVDDEYFRQIVSEKVVTRYNKGIPRLEWVLPHGRRNEALDCTVLAYAAALRVGLARMDWDGLERALKAAGTAAAEGGAPPPPAPGGRGRGRALPQSNWMQRAGRR